MDADRAASIGELSAEFAKQKRPKSPPLAFEKTSNDTLAPLTSPDSQTAPVTNNNSTLDHIMGRLSPPRLGEEPDLQVVVDQQAAAMQLLHDAFAAERQAWSLEKDRLYHRIASLEKLLKTDDGYSPAKSPILSPLNNSNITSPQSRSINHSSRLPSIAEDEPIPTLAQRREQGRHSIDMPEAPVTQSSKERSVKILQDTPTAEIVSEIAVSPPSEGELSPPPRTNIMEAGHTPLRAPRPLTPPPNNNMSVDGIDDTPTRNNTHINASLSRSTTEDEDPELKGPLNMPELPNKPDETNFTLDMLSKRLEQMEKDPNRNTPTVFSDRSPDPASPHVEPADVDKLQHVIDEQPLAPVPSTALEPSAPEPPSDAKSPPAVLSPSASQEEVEDRVQADFESGGIKLKKKASTNFGAPFGSLGGFGSRRISQDWQ